MLVIDLHTLQTVHILYLVDDILLDSRETLDGKDIGRRDDTVREWRTSTHSIMLLDKDLLGKADEILALLARLRRDDNLAITTLHLAQLDLAIDFADDSRVGRVASLEKLRDTRQTTSDITSTTHRTRNLDQRLTRSDERTLGEGRLQVTTHREVVRSQDIVGGIVTIGLLLSVLSHDIDRRYAVLVLRLGDDALHKTRSFIGLGTVGDAINNIAQMDLTLILADNDRVERIPLTDQIALLHLVALLEVERGTIGDILRREHDVRIDIDKADLAQTADNHAASLLLIINEGNSTQLVKLQLAIVLGYNLRIGSGITSHTTGVECTKSKLRTRLTDRLSSNHTDSLAQLHHTGGSKVAAITLHTDTLLALTSEH